MSAELNANLKRLDTEELIYKINNSMLTLEAHKEAIRVLIDRGVNVNSLKQKPEDFTQAKTYGIESEEEKSQRLKGMVRGMNEHKIAPLWNRVGGALIDFIVVMVVSFVICFVWGFFIGLSGTEQYLSKEETDALWKGRGMLVGLLVDGIYTVVMMTGEKQSTYGQRAVGIRIVKDNGTTIGFGTAIGRWITSLFSSILLKIGFLIAVFTTNKKTLHDLVAGTIVVVAENQNFEYTTKNSQPHTSKFSPQQSSNNLKVPSAKRIESMEDAYTRISPAMPISQTHQAAQSTNYAESKKIEVSTINEDELWAVALSEFESEKRNKGLWTRLFVENEGNEEKIKIAYLKCRASQLIEDAKVQQQLIQEEIFKIERLKAQEDKRRPSINFDLGMRIYKGYGDNPPNPAEAFKFLYEAAVGGVALAQFNLSLMYWKGDGVEKNKSEAYAWSRIAANEVEDAKENVKHFSKGMSYDEIIESDKLAKKYVDLITSNRVINEN